MPSARELVNRAGRSEWRDPLKRGQWEWRAVGVFVTIGGLWFVERTLVWVAVMLLVGAVIEVRGYITRRLYREEITLSAVFLLRFASSLVLVLAICGAAIVAK